MGGSSIVTNQPLHSTSLHFISKYPDIDIPMGLYHSLRTSRPTWTAVWSGRAAASGRSACS